MVAQVDKKLYSVYRTGPDTCVRSNHVFLGYVEAEDIDEIMSKLPDDKMFYGWSVSSVVPKSLSEVLKLGSNLKDIFG